MTTFWARPSGLRLLINLNFDRLFYALSLSVALVFGAWVGTVLFPG